MPSPAESARLQALLRRLPSVDEVLRSPLGQELLAHAPRSAVIKAARAEIDRLRKDLLRNNGAKESGSDARVMPDMARLQQGVAALLRPSLGRVINATGVVLHTNLGRAPLAPEAARRAAEIALAYSNLEYQVEEGGRGQRQDHVAGLLCDLTGAEAACVVNNNAGAVLCALAALAAGREAIVSRGELVEIGGSFRVPDVMRASGAILREVGTTNKTRLADYADAISPATALLLKVHRSNFAIVGFTAEVPLAALAALGQERGVASMIDLGSGSLVDLAAYGLPHEPTVPDAVRAGADVVTFSGDKLLGGPQAGILCGKAAAIAKVRSHPLLRALRCDKMTLAALEATLELYRDGRAGEIPTLALLASSGETLRARAERLLAAIRASAPDCAAELRPVRSAVGGGALPLCEPESWAVALMPGGRLGSAEVIEATLRAAAPPIIGRIAEGVLLLDVRTVFEGDIAAVAQSVARQAKQ